MQLIEDLYAGKPAATSTPAPSPVESSRVAGSPPPPAVEIPAPEAVPPASLEPEPPPAPQVPLPPAQERAIPTGEPQKVNIALSLTFAGLRGSVVPRSQLPETRTLIQPEQRDRFITHVFRGDAAHYAGALVMLDSLKSWRDAEAFLQELYRTNNVDPETSDTIEFSHTIRRRYAAIEKAP